MNILNYGSAAIIWVSKLSNVGYDFCACVGLVNYTLIDKHQELWVVKIVTGKFGILAEKLNDNLEQSVVGFSLSVLFIIPVHCVGKFDKTFEYMLIFSRDIVSMA